MNHVNPRTRGRGWAMMVEPEGVDPLVEALRIFAARGRALRALRARLAREAASAEATGTASKDGDIETVRPEREGEQTT